VKEAAARLMDGEQATVALQYHPTEGYLPLRQMLATQMQDLGVPCTAENILITSGSQQSIDLLGKVLINPGDKVIVEKPTFLGFLQAWGIYGADFVSVETDDDGIIPESLAAALQQGIKAIYLIPNFQNPTGVTISAKRRAAVVALADQYGVPLLEDDPYGRLRYEGDALPPLMAYDVRHVSAGGDGPLSEGNVVYLGSFSKTFCPGIRIAWACGPTEIIKLMTQAKQGSDLHTSTFGQMLTYEVARDGFIDVHVARLIKAYRARRDLMLHLMDKHFPENVSWTHPKGGLFLWVRLPEELDAQEVFQTAIKRNVAFVPGQSFFPDGGGKNTLRLNFSNAYPELIEEGILRLAEVLSEIVAPVS
jgi:2-aminoadipate transaminase